MPYLIFLVYFLLVPIILLSLLALWDQTRGKPLPPALQGHSLLKMLGVLIVIALVYTTPWDNYLVATRVWWYNPELVMGITLGWVPLEEYLFFALQPLMIGLWLLLLARRLPVPNENNGRSARVISVSLAGAIWLAAVIILFTGWQPGTYLALELAWALPPILLQLIFGADILLRHRRLVLLTIIPVTLYLSLADTVAIAGGTWTIDPAQSLGMLLGGILPVEEFVFFLLTTVLVTFGLVLSIATESRRQLRALVPTSR
ncbi:MAG: lycopene cyclase domain-containing protein [Caldilineaceae bacterium]|nr:lycopene cyclase domain-containing protein [Caldilineaceae bacterium]